MRRAIVIALLLPLFLQAARDFDNDDSLLVNTAPVTGAPFSWCADFNVDTTAVGQRTVAFLGDKDVGAHYLVLETDNDDFVFRVNAGGTAESAQIVNILTAGTWYRGCGVAVSATDRRVFIDGGNKATNTVSMTPAGVDRIAAGRRMRSTPDNPFDGKIGLYVVWDVALSDADIAALGGPLFDMRCIRPENIAFYSPLNRDLVDLAGGLVLTDATTAVADNPRMITCGGDGQ